MLMMMIMINISVAMWKQRGNCPPPPIGPVSIPRFAEIQWEVWTHSGGVQDEFGKDWKSLTWLLENPVTNVAIRGIKGAMIAICIHERDYKFASAKFMSRFSASRYVLCAQTPPELRPLLSPGPRSFNFAPPSLSLLYHGVTRRRYKPIFVYIGLTSLISLFVWKIKNEYR